MKRSAVWATMVAAGSLGILVAGPASSQSFDHAVAGVPTMPRGDVRLEDCLGMALHTVAGEVDAVEFKSEEGVPRYEFQIVAFADGSTWNVDCNGLTGFVEHIERHVSPDDDAFSSRATIDQAAAEAIALELAPGEIDVREWILNQEGHAVYVFDIHMNTGGEIKVEIRADNGAVHGFNPEYWEIGEGD